MVLELAESNTPQNTPYIRVPAHLSRTGRDQWVREDIFDDLPRNQWIALMDALQPYNEGMTGILSNWKKKREERKELRNEKKEAKTDIKKARAEKIRAGGGRILDTVGGIVGSIFGGGQQTAPGTPQPAPDLSPRSGSGLPGWVLPAAGLALAGGIVYMATRPKSRKR